MFHTICGPLGSFLCPQITFFAYYMGPHRSVSSHTIWGPLSDQFHCLIYGIPPLRSVSFAYYRRATSHLGFFHKIYGGPLRSVSPLTIWGPLRSVSVHTFWGPLSDQFFLLLYGAPLRSVFSLTIWAPPDQILCILYGGPLRSVSLSTIWGSPEISFFAYYMRAPLRSVSSLTIWGPH